MQRRTNAYLLLTGISVLLLLLYKSISIGRDCTACSNNVPHGNKPNYKDTVNFPIKLPNRHYINYDDLKPQPVLSDQSRHLPSNPDSCRMDNCFDFSKCSHGFKVYIYPMPHGTKRSESYHHILNVIENSEFYTKNAEEACLFISGVDTVDQDKLSNDYIPNLQAQLHSLPYWNKGINHLIFNIYSGTWPDYSEKLGVGIGYAMLAKASISTHYFRAGFDVSLPLFHKTLPEYVGEEGRLNNINIPSNRPLLLAFKGKRYLSGIGSESRNQLYHIHNGKDIIMLTTCKHGKGWESLAKLDSRCDIDNEMYDRPEYDYRKLLRDSTFCLVPRGRRLGSYRFLEVLQYGCIPVLLSDSWELPFSDVIDWKQAAIWADEELLYQVPYSLRSLPYTTITSYQQQSQHLWSTYFNSIQKIVLTTLQIVKERVEPHLASPRSAWNSYPGVNALEPLYSKHIPSFPYYYKSDSNTKYTVIYRVYDRSMSMRKIIESISSAEHVHCIYLLAVNRPDLQSYLSSVASSISSVPVTVKDVNAIADSLRLYRELPTDAVLFINQRDKVITKELDFAFSVWKEYPERIVGYLARSYLRNEGDGRYYYSSKLSNEYSIVLLDTAVVHRYYLYKVLELVSRWHNDDFINKCEDLLLNFLVSDITRFPPVKLSGRLSYKESYSHDNHFLMSQHDCFNSLHLKFGYIPLKMSQVRYDPALFKDNVAKIRKNYVELENA